MPAPATGTYIDQPAAETPAEDSPTAEIWRTTEAALDTVDHKWPHVIADALDDDDAPVSLHADADGRLRVASTTGDPIIVAPHEAAMNVEFTTAQPVTIAPDVVRVESTVLVSAASSAYTAGDVIQDGFVLDDALPAPGVVRLQSLILRCDGDPVFGADTEVDLWAYDASGSYASGMDNDPWDGGGPGADLIGIFRAAGANYALQATVDVVYPCTGVDLRVVAVLAGGTSPTFAGSEDLYVSIVAERF